MSPVSVVSVFMADSNVDVVGVRQCCELVLCTGCAGCKIKALRAKTNTYIKTPARGDEPVFVITGRREDVSAAKQEILSAAEHFSQIRASRRVAASGSASSSSARSPTSVPTAATSGGGANGHVTCEVRVPVRSVGLVVGPKGSTVKRIQQLTQTYIVTPSRGTEPVFEVVGSPDNVERAKREIESRVQQQRGGGSSGIRCSGPPSAVDLPLPSTTLPGVVGCWNHPASSSTSSSMGFPDVIISNDEFSRGTTGFAAASLQSDPQPLVDVWNRGKLRGLRSAEAVPRGFSDLLSSLGGGVGGLGLLNDPTSLASTFDGDEGIGSLSPDPLGLEGSPWSRTTAGLTAALGAECTSVSGRRSWIDVDLSATSGTGLETGGGSRLGAVVDWNGNGKAVRYTDSSSDSPTDCISVTPPRSPMACLFG